MMVFLEEIAVKSELEIEHIVESRRVFCFAKTNGCLYRCLPTLLDNQNLLRALLEVSDHPHQLDFVEIYDL